MKKAIVAVLTGLVLASSAGAADFKVNGVYTAWGQSQHHFWLGKGKYNDNYVVQMLRFNVQGIVTKDVKFVTRLDIAQGWWGVDNALRSVQRTGTKGGSALFDFKDTNFLVHVDQAYISFRVPNQPVTFRVGRMWYGLGHKIMLDNNYEGVQVDITPSGGGKFSLGWAKVSEGVDGLSDEASVAPDQRGFTDARDAHLFLASYAGKTQNFSYQLYGFFYNDASIADGNAYVPDHLQFFKTRFSPQISQLTALGFTGKYQAGKLTVDGEVDVLFGKDKIDNQKHGAKQMWDINNGDLSGYNLYLKLNYAAADKVTLGGVFGMGSGDDDLTSGKGNVNKLRTSGFFYITEVWEDSIMPDEEGITPQGLGAPNVRGYRELENTTALQVNTLIKPRKDVQLFFAYTYLRATQPIHAWGPDGEGDWRIDPDKSAQDIGQEVDFRISYNMYKQLNLTLRGGYFMPGKAAGYLINGTDEYNKAAWELKATVTLKF
jgi:hypothetical protein